MSVQILIGALLIGDVPSGYDHLYHRATVGDGYRLCITATPHPVSLETPVPAPKACRLTTPALDTAPSRIASSQASSTTPLFRPLLRHILMPPGI